MNSVNKTLYIPLYGKAYVSAKGLFLKDPKAEEIWAAEGFPLKGKAASKWLAYYMGIRSAVFDAWTARAMETETQALVLHIGCGLDSRVMRVDTKDRRWFDIDLPAVIAERKRYFTETDTYCMLPADVREEDWLASLPQADSAIVVMEGVSMYLTTEELRTLTEALARRFEHLSLLTDCYTTLAAKLSKRKNPINEVGVTTVYGLDDPLILQQGDLRFVTEHPMTPKTFTEELHGMEKRIFKTLYGGKLSEKLYRLYEYRKG